MASDGAYWIRELRRRSGLTQAELGARAGMAQSAISDYERGRKEPSLSTLDRLATAVGLRLSVGHSEDPSLLGTLHRRRREILAVCDRHGASNPRVFGSVAKGTSGSDSDIDLLVDLAAGRTLFDIAALHDDLVELLGRDVDILTPGALHGRLASVATEAVLL